MEKDNLLLDTVSTDADQVSSMDTDTLQVSSTVTGSFPDSNMDESGDIDIPLESDKTGDNDESEVKFLVHEENAGDTKDNFIQISLRSSTRAGLKDTKSKASEIVEPKLVAADEDQAVALKPGQSEEDATQIICQQELNDAIAAAVGSSAEEMVETQEIDETEKTTDNNDKETEESILPEMSEEELMWNQNNCIICNIDLDDAEHVEKKDMSPDTKQKLKKFFCEYLGVRETVDMGDDNFVPFCASCSGDIDKLVSLACKIEFMDAQFEKLRDTLARKTVKTYLYRSKPELLDEDADLVPDTVDEPLDTAEPLKYSHPADLLFNHWKRQYDMIIPGRFKKFPVLMKAVDLRQRVSYYRIDNAGKHHFIATVDTDQDKQDEENQLSGIRLKKPNKRRITKLGEHHSMSPVITNKKIRFEEGLSGDSQDEEPETGRVEEVGLEDSDKRVFQCMECPRSYPTKSLLKYHTRIHSGERPYKCTDCTKSFAQRGGLATHLLVHSGEKPFVCEECGKHFRQKYHLTQHKFIHSGVKPFQCEVCDKRFNVKMNLKEHMRRHTGDRPYRCDHCNSIGFFRKKKLRDHMVKLHPNIPLPTDLVNLGPTKTPKKGSPDTSIQENNLESDSENKNDDNDYVPTTDDEVNQETGPVIVRTASGRTVKPT